MEETWELATLTLTPLTLTVIGRPNRPIHDVDIASGTKGGSMDHPIKSGDDGQGMEEPWNIATVCEV